MFTTGLLLAVLLLALPLRALNLPGSPIANLMFALCALLWTSGGLVYAALAVSGGSRRSPMMLAAQAVQLLGEASFPIPILAIWRPFATQPWQKSAARLVLICAVATAAALGYFSWIAISAEEGRLRLAELQPYIAYSAAVLLFAGAAISLRWSSTPRPIYLASLAIVIPVFGASL